jgi:hypothetical protein
MHGMPRTRYECSMRFLRILLVLAAVLGLALAATSAAGAAGAAGASRDNLSPAAYRAQASVLCTQAKKRIALLPKSGSAKPAQVATALGKALDTLNPLLAGFRKLAPPASLQAAHDSTVKGVADGLKIGHTIADAVVKGSNLQQAMAKVQGPFLVAISSIQNGFKQLGLKNCESLIGSAIGGS